MSYDIYLYQRDFMKRALAQNLEDLTDPDPIPGDALTRIRERLLSKGYIQEDDCEFTHPNPKWGTQVEIFNGEVGFGVAYWDEADKAIQAVRRDAKELAELADLALYDPQTGEIDI